MTSGYELIHNLQAIDGSLNLSAIKKIIPYSDKFLFVDSIKKIEPQSIEANYYIKPDLEFLASHFVDFPVMPGALITEGFAQAGTVLIRYNLEAPEDKDILICKVEDARFLRPCFSGMSINYAVKLKTLGSHAARIAGNVYENDLLLSSFVLVLAIVNRSEFRKKVK
jgi:3-hydroxymyristoyl/3-hydroxydecanoyl-(acyl carrier protein) dehydratase